MTLYTATIMLTLIMNPIGNIPMFLSTLKPVAAKKRTRIILRETFIAFLFLTVFMFFGQYFLRSVQISPQALGMAGGIILFLIALRMIFPENKTSAASTRQQEPFIIPLAIPATAGPGALTTVMLFATQNPDRRLIWLIAIIFSSAIFSAIILGANYLSNVFSDKGLIALQKLSGMLLTAMAVQMFLTGLDTYFRLH